MTLADELGDGLAGLRLAIPPIPRQRLLDYVALLEKWNRVYNLTALRDPHKILSHHLLDSLSVLPHIRGRTMADIGSGGGTPGIPLAIACPDLHITLVEPNTKKSVFLQQVRIELGLQNVAVSNSRAEEFRPPNLFEIVISRAFAELVDFVRASRHLLEPKGRFYAMKGMLPKEEISRLPPGCEVERTIRLDVPYLGAERHLLVLKETS